MLRGTCLFVFLYACGWVLYYLLHVCLFFTFFLGGSQNTYWYRLLLLLLSFGVLPAGIWLEGLYILFESTPFDLLDTCSTGFLIAPYIHYRRPAVKITEFPCPRRLLEYLIFPIREKGLSAACRFLSGDLLLRIMVAFALSRDSCRQYKQDRVL